MHNAYIFGFVQELETDRYFHRIEGNILLGTFVAMDDHFGQQLNIHYFMPIVIFI